MFLFIKVKKTQEMKDDLDSMYCEASPLFATVKNW